MALAVRLRNLLVEIYMPYVTTTVEVFHARKKFPVDERILPITSRT